MRGLARQRWVAGAVGLAVATVGLAACSSSSNNGSSGGTGGTLTVSMSQPQTLLPTNVQDAESVQPVSILYTGLVSYNEKGEAVNQMADSITSSDNKVFDIKIKSGWTFHDGSPVTAASYVNAWNFGASKAAAQVNQSYFSAIKGYADQAAGKTKTMSGLKILSNTEFQATLDSTNSQWPLTLGYQAFGPLAQACLSNPKSCATKPIGNGPYKFVSWKNNVELDVTKYDGYKGTAGKVDAINFKIYSDPTTSLNDAIAGNLDLQRGIPAARVKEVKTKYPDNYAPITLASTYMIAFPLYLKGSGYDDLKVRQAFSLSFNRQQVVDKLLDPTYTPATAVLPPNFPAFQPDVCESCKFDPTQAKSLIQQSGFKGPLEIFTNGDTPLLKVYQAIAVQSTQNLGIQVVVKTVPTFDQFLTQRQERKMTGAFRSAWVADWPTPDNYLKNLFFTSEPGASANDTAYSNAEVDKLITQAISEQDLTKANDLFDQAQVQILKDLSMVPLFWGGDSFYKGSAISNLNVTPFDIVLYAGISKN